ncbi:MAG: DMT family transporter [Cellulomonadaceae bacterium]|nr:DMT family transporter [Cellulomonadaceae bacterium]
MGPVNSRASSPAVSLAAACVAGLVSAIQTQVNGQLGAQLGPGPTNALLAALMSFTGGLVIALILVLVSHRARTGLKRVAASLRGAATSGTRQPGTQDLGTPTIGHLRWYHVIGGAAGGLFVTTQSLTVPVIGVALFVVGVTAGQSVGSLACDRLGIAPGGKRALTPTRLIGPLLTVAAVVITRWTGMASRSASDLWLVALPTIAGIIVALQLTINSRVEKVASSPVSAFISTLDDSGGLRATGDLTASAPHPDRVTGVMAAVTLNFMVGTAALLVAFVGFAAILGTGDLATGPGVFQWWMFLGGPLGLIFIAISAAVISRIGALLLALAIIAGQTVGAVILDAASGRPTAWTTLVGVALVIIAVAVPAFLDRRSTAHGDDE